MNPTYELRGTTAWIRLDDGKANAMRTDGLIAFGEMLDRAQHEQVRSIVIRGRDGMFSGGLDVKWLPTLDADGGQALVRIFSTTMMRVLNSTIPTIALVSGHAIAGGCMLACACDRRIGVRGDFRMQMNEVAVGIPMPSWAALIASSAIPAPRLYDVLQLAESLAVAEARELGTLHELADDFVELDEMGEKAASLLALLDPPAFAQTKRSLWSEPSERVLKELGVG